MVDFWMFNEAPTKNSIIASSDLLIYKFLKFVGRIIECIGLLDVVEG